MLFFIQMRLNHTVNTTWHQNAIALTGTSGAGKSTVSNLLKNLGAAVLSADELARAVVTPGSAVLAEIAQTFGQNFILPSGELDRKALGELVFSHPDKRKQLETITHPAIRFLADQEARRLLAANPPLLVYDCPLLFESGLDKLGFKSIVLVTAPEAACIDRICRRDNLTREAAVQRLNSQVPESEKRARADIIIENSSSLADLEKKVGAVYDKLTGP